MPDFKGDLMSIIIVLTDETIWTHEAPVKTLEVFSNSDTPSSIHQTICQTISE